MELQVVLHSLLRRSGLPRLLKLQAVLHCLHLREVTSGSAARPATLLEQVGQLGHFPKRCKNPRTDKKHAEHSLAKIGYYESLWYAGVTWTQNTEHALKQYYHMEKLKKNVL